MPAKAQLEQFIGFDYVCFFIDSVQAIGSGENVTVAGGVAKTLTCPVDGNPEPKIEWYNKKTGRKITSGNQLEPRESGCYTCVASNSLGTSVNITQCLIICKSDHAHEIMVLLYCSFCPLLLVIKKKIVSQQIFKRKDGESRTMLMFKVNAT